MVTDKKSTSFRLSPLAKEQLIGLSERYGISQASVLEMLIRDRALTSDPLENALRRTRAWDEYKKTRTIKRIQPSQLFSDGYNTGWLHFQTRHDKEKW